VIETQAGIWKALAASPLARNCPTCLTIPKGRFNWLLVNSATAFSGVLGARPVEGQLKRWWRWRCWRDRRSQGGNAATQTMTVAVRAADRELGPNNGLSRVMREAWSASSTGLPLP